MTVEELKMLKEIHSATILTNHIVVIMSGMVFIVVVAAILADIYVSLKNR